jgi:hypothetical protein
MDRRKQSNGWLTFLGHWGFLLLALVALAVSPIFMFFFNLNGTPWIQFFVADMVILFSGAGLILYAKIPVYQSGRFFTFGVKSIPESVTRYYRWGWRVFLFGVVLSLCLLLSKP